MSKKFLLFTVFLTGLTITAVELTISHIVAPYFGASLIVWTNVIGIILAGLALGYYVGGRIADKHPQQKYLYIIILISGILFFIIPFLIKPLAQFAILNPFNNLTSSTITVFLTSFFLIVLLFFPPISLLATVSPFIIKLTDNKQNNLGQTSGKIFAIGTIGSLIGTFLPVFIFIPYLGSKQTIFLFGSIMIILAILGLSKNKMKFLSLALIILPFSTTSLLPIKNTQGTILEIETPYQYIQVTENNEKKYLFFNESTGPQTIYDPSSILTNSYYDYFSVLPYLLPKQKNLRVLILGLAAGAMNNQYHYFFKDQFNLEIDGVELDPQVTKIAQQHFNLNTAKLNIHNTDARYFLKQTNQKYDLILIDAYKQYYLPEHLMTVEFFDEVKRKLNPNGIMALNFVVASKNQLYHSVNNTISTSFENVYDLPIPAHYNYMVLASNQQLDFNKLKKIDNNILKETAQYFKTIETYQPTSHKVFTDNKSNINLMTDLMLIKELRP